MQWNITDTLNQYSPTSAAQMIWERGILKLPGTHPLTFINQVTLREAFPDHPVKTTPLSPCPAPTWHAQPYFLDLFFFLTCICKWHMICFTCLFGFEKFFLEHYKHIPGTWGFLCVFSPPSVFPNSYIFASDMEATQKSMCYIKEWVNE